MAGATPVRLRSGPGVPRFAVAERHNLPAALTTFVGRERESAAVRDALRDGRLVTLCGAGGIGKTRLALEVAGSLTAAMEGGVWLIELADIADAAAVPRRIAAAIGQREHADREITETLVDRLRFAVALLVVDNCEQVGAGVAGVLRILLAACAELRVLATSRVSLGVAGERVFVVPSLPAAAAGAAPDDVLASPAVRLFAERARLVAPTPVPAEKADIAARICRRLEGIPLAIELAAARSRVLTLEQIDAHLDDTLGLLSGGPRSAAPRHQTLRASIDWSHDLLHHDEQVVLRRLAIFRGGFSMEAAEEVCGDAGLARTVLDLVTGLIDSSLVVADTAASEARYSLLEPIRQYASDRLTLAAESADLRHRHVTWVAALAEGAEPGLHGPEAREWLERCEREHDNIRLALQNALLDEPAAALAISAALWRFWHVRGYLREGRAWLEAALDAWPEGDGPLVARACRGAGVLARMQGDFDASRGHHQRALALATGMGDRCGRATSLNNLGILAWSTGALEQAMALFRECGVIHGELGDERGMATSINNMGTVARVRGHLDEAAALCEDSVARYRAIGFDEGTAASLLILGKVALKRGDLPAARSRLLEALCIFRDLGYREGVAEVLECLGLCATAAHQDHRALHLLAAAATLREQVGAPVPSPDEVTERAEAMATLRSRLDAEDLQNTWSAGRVAAVEDVVTMVGVEPVGDIGAAPRPGGLSAREVEVAVLVAQGLRDRALGDHLHISPRTVGKHIENIRNKLGLETRSQLGAWVVHAGLTEITAT